jgi:hypothetical protein
MSNSENQAAGARWEPEVGTEVEAVIQKLPFEERGTLREETREILGNCVPPNGEVGHRTGLVVGYVQSGKTLSFTTVSALAHDNGFRLIIVIAGTSTNLLHQSTDRLLKDLNAEGFWGRWQIYRSDESDLKNASAEGIQAHLQRWEDPDVDDEEKQTVLISVMKERAHLDRLIRLLRKLDLATVPALIIDDEADQASLNIGVRSGQESATYRRILEVRSLLPRHTFLQYTATPQALLLINLIDQLSPDFGKVLTPGEAYTGGVTFFHGGLDLVRSIPPGDIPSNSQQLLAPPDSLLQALQLFFIGVAAGMANRWRDALNRSMMIHPAHRTDPHVMYVHWVRSAMDQWLRTLELDPEDTDRRDLVEEFRDAYNDVASTIEDLIPFDSLLRRLPRAIRETRVEELNARGGSTPLIHWKRNYSWILVGGQGLDRGFTVEGLTVTYMPRGLGVGNADTVQQRARWFGYKAAYLGYCRVFLPNDVISVFEDYVTHEEDVRKRLVKHLTTGKPLKEWRRAFLLSGVLNPTRKNVLGHDVTRGNYIDRWFSPRSPHASPEAIQANRSTVERFVSSISWHEANDDPRLLNSHRHEVSSGLRLQDVNEQLLLDFAYPAPSDSLDYTGVLLQIAAFLDDHPNATCTIYRMRPGETTARGTDDEGEEISQLFQGAYPVEGDPKVYPGDRRIRSDTELTIQIHQIDVYNGPVSQGNLLEEKVPVLAVFVPSEYSAAWVVQEKQDVGS